MVVVGALRSGWGKVLVGVLKLSKSRDDSVEEWAAMNWSSFGELKKRSARMRNSDDFKDESSCEILAVMRRIVKSEFKNKEYI